MSGREAQTLDGIGDRPRLVKLLPGAANQSGAVQKSVLSTPQVYGRSYAIVDFTADKLLVGGNIRHD